MRKISLKNKIKELEEKLSMYEERLAEKRKDYSDVVRTRFGDSYEDQLRDDTNSLELIIESLKAELKSLKSI